MRSALIFILTFGVIFGAFGVYLYVQPSTAQKGGPKLAAVRERLRAGAATTQSLHGMGSGDNPWIKRFENGELGSQFRGERYDPQKDGTVYVTKPEAEFFSRDGQRRVKLSGATGIVHVPPGPEGQQQGAQLKGGVAMQPPTWGTLQDVVISMYEPADAAEPALVGTMNNAAFDNDKFRIATEAFTDGNGRRVEADQVPVTVRGRDYDFSGRGMVIRWNERDQKLQLLEIAHGEFLTVKDVSALSKAEIARAGGTAPTPVFHRPRVVAPRTSRAIAPSRASTFAPVVPVAQSAAQARRRRQNRPPPPPSSRPKITRDTSPVVYRATFEENVRIFEADVQIVAADRLNIELLQEADADPAPPGHPAPDEGAPLDAAPVAPTTKPAKRDRHAVASTAPTSQAIKGPIVVRWTGKLRVVPLEGPPADTLVPGQASVHMIGSPVVLNREGTEAKSGEAFFNSADGSATLKATPVVPIVTLTDSSGARVTTPSLSYSETPDGKRIATLVGASRLEGGSGKDAEPFALTWTKDGRLELIDVAAGKTMIDRADFAGDVRVEHAQLNMTGDVLSLGFDPSRALKSAATAPAADAAAGATTKPAGDDILESLREIVATGNVNCLIIDEHQKRQTIATQKLRVETDRTPAGRTFPRLLRAEGDVKTTQGGDTLRAGHLTAEMTPTTRAATQPAPQVTVDAGDAKSVGPFGGAGGDIKLASLVARDNVRLTTEDGTHAAADMLKVETVNGLEQYHLIGAPLATVGDGKQTTISGPRVRFSPDERIAEVIGGGTIHGVSPDRPGETLDITWAGGAVVNGATDLIDVTDQVRIVQKQLDGTINTSTGDRLRAKLQPKATTAPATVAAAGGGVGPVAIKPAASTKPAGDDRMNFLADKDITSAMLIGNCEVKSELFAADGTIARGLNLFAPVVNYDRATGRMEVAAAGKMLYQDHRPPEQKKAGGADGGNEGPTLGSGRGATAFEWSKWLVYDAATMQAVITGDVQVVHHPDSKDSQPFNLWADSLTALMEPDPAAAQPTTRSADAITSTKMRLKRVIARGNTKVTSTRLNFHAHELSYDPQAGILRAAGDVAKPMTIHDTQKGTATTAGRLEWNTKTDEFHVQDAGGRVRP